MAETKDKENILPETENTEGEPKQKRLIQNNASQKKRE